MHRHTCIWCYLLRYNRRRKQLSLYLNNGNFPFFKSSRFVTLLFCSRATNKHGLNLWWEGKKCSLPKSLVFWVNYLLFVLVVQCWQMNASCHAKLKKHREKLQLLKLLIMKTVKHYDWNKLWTSADGLKELTLMLNLEQKTVHVWIKPTWRTYCILIINP